MMKWDNNRLTNETAKKFTAASLEWKQHEAQETPDERINLNVKHMWSFYNLLSGDEFWDLDRRCFALLKEAIRLKPG